MMPKTRNGHPALLMISAMQKAIRRGEEADAMAFACELIHTSKAYCTMVLNRLVVITHEDIDTCRAPYAVPFVATAIEQAADAYAKRPENPGGCRMIVGNVIRMLARAPKSREGDHFQAAIGLRNLLERYVPEVPDHAFDKHTTKGKRMGRGIEHFRAEGAALFEATLGTNGRPLDLRRVPEDSYADEAYRMWARLAEVGAPPKPERAKNESLDLDEEA